MELEYFRPSSIVDYSMILNEEGKSAGSQHSRDWDRKSNRVGVSVTRAMKYKGTFELEDATRLLNKKLKGCIDATNAVCEDCAWDKVVLHVLVEKRYMVDVLVHAWHEMMDKEMRERNDVIIVLTVCAERSEWMFYEKKMKKNDAASLKNICRTH